MTNKAFDLEVELEVVCIWASSKEEAVIELKHYLCPGLELGNVDINPTSLSDAEAREFAMNPGDAP